MQINELAKLRLLLHTVWSDVEICNVRNAWNTKHVEKITLTVTLFIYLTYPFYNEHSVTRIVVCNVFHIYNVHTLYFISFNKRLLYTYYLWITVWTLGGALGKVYRGSCRLYTIHTHKTHFSFQY